MKATDHLVTAFCTAMTSDPELHKKWISVSFALSDLAGVAHLVSAQRIGRLDMLLRLIESERLERMADGHLSEPDLSLDVQFALSESWLLSTYEVVRAAKEHLSRRRDDNRKLIDLEVRLAIARMPIAKGEIRGMNLEKNKVDPPMLLRAGDDTPEAYRNDGSYVVPCGLCGETGALVWYPVAIENRDTVAICRRDLSEEMLALFD